MMARRAVSDDIDKLLLAQTMACVETGQPESAKLDPQRRTVSVLPMTRFAKYAALLALTAITAPATAAAPAPADSQTSAFEALDADFAKWMAEAHVPGLVWGIVKDGKLVHVKAMGVQTVEDKAPATPDTAFRIASMTKAFTGYSILKLRDEGKLRLDDPVSQYVPETKGWAKGITIGDLLHHTAGFVTDDPWGDRQQPLPEAEFTKMLKAGVPFSTAPGTRYEYSNFGFALLGRIVTSVSKQEYSKRVEETLLKPLGMKSSRYEVREVPADKLAMGYRWENDAWSREPVMPHGAFGAMGGLVTTGNDYAKWIGYLLDAWPARDQEVMSRKTVRAMQYGGGMLHARRRPGKEGDNCRLSAIYGAGLVAANDCVLGNVLFHGGGFPGLWQPYAADPRSRGRPVRADQPHLCRAQRAGLGCGDYIVPLRLYCTKGNAGDIRSRKGLCGSAADMEKWWRRIRRTQCGDEFRDGPQRCELAHLSSGAFGAVGRL